MKKSYLPIGIICPLHLTYSMVLLSLKKTAAEQLIKQKVWLLQASAFPFAPDNAYNMWGVYHEQGHNHQDDQWDFEGYDEMTCNIFAMFHMENMAKVGSAWTLMI